MGTNNQISYSIVYLAEINQTHMYSFDKIQWKTVVWPLEITGQTQLEITTDLNLSNGSNWIKIVEPNVIIDGHSNIINIKSISYYPGLVANKMSNVQIKNIGIQVDSSTLFPGAGWLGQSDFGSGAVANEISNCYSTGPIDSVGSGGIIGLNSGSNGHLVISNCYSTGEISGTEAGGICGSTAGFNGSVQLFTCYSTGQISGSRAGGIYGMGAGYNGGKSSVINSYSSGLITGTEAGGIYSESTTYLSNRADQSCYIANGQWSNSEANGKLIGIPSLTQPIGDNWSLAEPNATNKPYLLSGFNQENYQPNFVTKPKVSGSGSTYSSIPGAFANRSYVIIGVNKNNFTSSLPTQISQSSGVIQFSQLVRNTMSVQFLLCHFIIWQIVLVIQSVSILLIPQKYP